MEKKMVRPYMTAEARDVLNLIHSVMDKEDRSESIVAFIDDYKEILSEVKCTLRKAISDERELRKKNQEWKVYCAVLACTTIASLVALAIQAA